MKSYRHRWIGISLLVIAFVLYAINNTAVPSFLAPPQETWGITANILDLIFNKVGINPLIVVLTALGAFYLVVGDLIEGVVSEQIVGTMERIISGVNDGFNRISDNIAKGIANVSADVIRAWIRNDNGTKTEYDEIGVLALKKSYGAHTDHDDSYFDSVKQTILDPALAVNSVHRRNVVTNIKLRAPIAPVSPEKRGFIVWDESKFYNLFTNGFPTDYEFIMTSRFPVDRDHLIDQLKESVIEISIGAGTRLSLKDIIPVLEKETINDQQNYATDDKSIVFLYDGTHASIQFTKNITLKTQATGVTVHEKTSFNAEDDSYTLTCRTPVRGFTFHMDVGPDFQFESFTFARDIYNESSARTKKTGWPDDRSSISVSTDEWIHPGIVLSVDWNPTTN